MTNVFDYYDQQILSEKLGKLGYVLQHKETMRSTMDFVSKKCAERKSFLVLTDHQTSGKGRHDNVWVDEKNKSLLMTMVEKESFINKMPSMFLSHLVALQICVALKKTTKRKEIKIKWPNDIMLDGKKIAGILIEKKKNSTFIGVGINIYESKITDSAYLLKKNKKFGRQAVLFGVMNEWCKLKKEVESDLLENKRRYYEGLWKKNSFILGKKVFMSLKNSAVIGVAKKSLLGEGVEVESNDGIVFVSENDYMPSSCVIK